MKPLLGLPMILVGITSSNCMKKRYAFTHHSAFIISIYGFFDAEP